MPLNPMYALALSNDALWHRGTTDIAPALAAMRVLQLEDFISRLLPEEGDDA